MDVLAYSTLSALRKELAKIEGFTLCLATDESDFMTKADSCKKEIVAVCHLDAFGSHAAEWILEFCALYPSLRTIALRNAPDVTEGYWLLKRGVKAYAHSLSNAHIIHQAIQSVANGHAWVYPELMQYIINRIPANHTSDDVDLKLLTPKEIEIANLVGEGLSNARIAHVLGIAEATVKKHIGTIFSKLHITDRLSLALIISKK